MSTPRLGCKYVFVPASFMDLNIFPTGAVVTVVPCPGMPNAKVPRAFRYVEHNGHVSMVCSVSLTLASKYKDFSSRNMEAK